ncbi:hypothetical protein [Streptomyces sp. 8L]|uniref:hypothetical protein n=1 Tax=Streptomyces sp. 8L TaxID=2877242 RepID=UPI001CD32870|nr:hypothetical protein [Streptomyces sp. 8L]MCA1221491.1 hypothetical protein [Streptomyces sp. 8L]
MSNGPENEPEHEPNTGAAGRDGAAGGTGGARGADASAPENELALRRLLQTAVDGIEPADGALDHLRAAIPARRARKRQALVGAAAAALLIGTAVPAFLHVAGASDVLDGSTVSAGRDESGASGARPDGGRSGAADNGLGPGEGAGKPGGATAGQKPTPHSDGPALTGRADGGLGSGAVSPPGSTFDMALPVCSAGQLGVTASKRPPTANGTVYGSFHVSNVSDTECTVTGGDTLGFVAAGAADPSKISVVQHTAGDPATRLPDAPGGGAAVALAPATAYEVQFAFVPSATCPAKGDGGSPDPSQSDDGPGNAPSAGDSPGSDDSAASGSDSGAHSPDAGAGTSDGLSTQLVESGSGTGGGGTQDGSVSVSHTPELGVPKAETTISNACAGTIYKTGPVGAPAA